MRISCVQMDMAFSEPEQNYARIPELLSQALRDEPDVIVLPETWNTGFYPRKDLAALSDRNGERIRAIIGGFAKAHNVNIVAGSISDCRDGKVYNTCYVFDRSGSVIASYDKTHLFSPMEEHCSYEKGQRVCRFTLDGIKCGVIICYDLRFAELTRTLALKEGGIEVLFVVSQWPKARAFHLRTLAAARAIENQLFVALCNSTGTAGETVYGGDSVILDPLGETLADAQGRGEKIIFADCDISQVEKVRNTIAVYRDRRSEIYDL